MGEACWKHAGIIPLANLQVKNVPDALHERLRRIPRERRRTLGDVVVGALEREVERIDWEARLDRRPATDLGTSAAALLEREREQRERDRP
jgi:hypothetical protein